MQGQARYQRSGKIVPEAYASLQDIIMKYGCFRLCDACGSEAAHRVVIRLAYAQIKHTGDPVTDLQNMIQWCQDRAIFDAVHALTLPLAPGNVGCNLPRVRVVARRCATSLPYLSHRCLAHPTPPHPTI